MRALAIAELTFSLLVAVGCRESAERKAEKQAAENGKICARLSALAGGQTSPAQMDICLSQIHALGQNARDCFGPCIEKSKDEIDYEICKDECTSHLGLAGTICQDAYTWDEDGRTTCATALVPLQTADRAKLACVDRCRKEEAKPGIEVCSLRCGAPALAPAKPFGGAAPAVLPSPSP